MAAAQSAAAAGLMHVQLEVDSTCGRRASFSPPSTTSPRSRRPRYLAMSQPSLAADNNMCPWCFAALRIQWCNKGPNKEKAYLVCEDIDLHAQRKPFWHWWGVVASRQARASLSSSPSPILANPPSFSFESRSALTTSTPSTSSAVSTTNTQTSSVRCRYVGGCQSTRVAPACKSQLCKKHCIILNNGLCPVKTHDPATMSQRQRREANVPPPARRRQLPSPPAASRAESSVGGFSPSFLSALDGIAQQQSFGWDYGPVLQQARIDSPGIYLDQELRMGMPPSPSLSPQDAADHEDEELQLALTLSLAPQSSSSAATSSSSASTSSSPASASPTMPPPSQPRVPASSVARRTPLPKPPRITTQLIPAWMSQATGTRPANDTFAVRQPSARRAPVDLTTVQRFTLVYWDADGKSPLILGVTECPSWPEFRLSESTRTLDLLGSNFTAVEFYNIRFCLWTRVDLAYTHILTSDTYLLLRRIGVSGLDEDRLIDHFVNLPGPQHIRYNVAAERAAVRTKIKARQTRAADNDDDVEIVKVGGIKIEPVDQPRRAPIADVVEVVDRPPPRMDRPLLRIVTGGAGAASNPICLDDDATSSSTASPSSSLFSAFPSLSPSTTPPASPFLWDNPQSSSTTSTTSAMSSRWPAGIYAVDMAQGFLRMEAADMQHIPLADRFQRVFQTSAPFVQRTYTDARLRWTRGSESLRTAALDAGRTKAGLWSAYAAQVPLKK
ncbi:hypothetical protein B0H14DRAFT_3131648 [Mycena olivaceomarginata]|nr:hypothetical protein B0H14DRAFT_3131648 [Mycena olivaceomarginata]